MPDRLPLFPLNLVLYPDEAVPLHIFEFRYREMIQMCMAENRAFGIVWAPESGLMDVGCTAVVTKILDKYENGEFDVSVTGGRRFRIIETFDNEPYLTADVAIFGVDEQEQEVDVKARERLITQHLKLLEMAGEQIRPEAYQGSRWISFLVGRNAGLELEQRQELLEMPTENERLEFLISHFSDVFSQVERVKQVVELSRGDGHIDGLPEL
ncbi:MAG: LON peptidase substrate-binding domain-containing protein [Rubricoccaceae bacterium]|nr:LON peptidase substrate-binding domain-containing protein [Rubricoccaceae bacterium]